MKAHLLLALLMTFWGDSLIADEVAVPSQIFDSLLRERAKKLIEGYVANDSVRISEARSLVHRAIDRSEIIYGVDVAEKFRAEIGKIDCHFSQGAPEIEETLRSRTYSKSSKSDHSEGVSVTFFSKEER